MDLIRIFLDSKLNLQIYIDNRVILLVTLLLILLGLYFYTIKNRLFGQYSIQEIEITIGNQKVKIKPNYQVKQIAYQLWLQLNTRKVGLKIDFENDVIIEVYKSWYDFFQIIRDLLQKVPVEDLEDQNTKKMVKLAINLLNEEIRPHLTIQQARFRKWYEEAQTNSITGEDPQQIQKKFPEYTQLINEMSQINQQLIKFKNELENIINWNISYSRSR
ncbi:hypothetical protein [Nostoc sp.]|uniref:hypothetical protein n=1 Tax=Nostoc sp. TaxID=1180 RepID=UPI002FFB7B88